MQENDWKYDLKSRSLQTKNFACVKKMTNMRYVWFVKCCLDQQSNVFVCLRSNEVALGPLLNGMVPTCTWWSEAVSQVSKLLGSTFLALFRRVRHVSCLKAAGDLSSPVPPLISSRFRLILWYFFAVIIIIRGDKKDADWWYDLRTRWSKRMSHKLIAWLLSVWEQTFRVGELVVAAKGGDRGERWHRGGGAGHGT